MTIVLGQDQLTIADVTAVARTNAAVTLGAPARQKLEAARDMIERWSRENRPVYGVTRGLGGRVTMDISAAERASYSAAVVRGRAAGGGGYFDSVTVRAALFARAAGLAQGGAGVRPIIIDTQLAMLAKGVHPLVPQVGSVGASDLVLCANMALPLMGDGRAEYQGEILPGGEAMRRAGIPVVDLVEKEGLALCSANALSVGLGALVLSDIIDLVELADAVLALSLEAFRGNPSPFDPRVAAARPAPGQVATAASLRKMLQGSQLFEPDAPRRVQDPLSLRCGTQVHGAARAAIDFVRPHIEVELNSAGDNPLIILDDDAILSTGNFHTPGLAISFDALRLALAQVATLSSERSVRMMQEELSGLAGRFSRHGATRVGLGLIGMTAHTLSREVRYFSAPVSNDDNTFDAVEDQAPFTPVTVRRAVQQIDYLRQVLACELIVSAQALEMRRPDRVAPVAAALHGLVRSAVAPLDDDRGTAEDIEKVSDLLREGKTLAAVRHAFPK
jgi:histidine ammonia-lyase